MQWTTLDSRASVEQPVLHLRREQFADTEHSDIEKYTATVFADCCVWRTTLHLWSESFAVVVRAVCICGVNLLHLWCAQFASVERIVCSCGTSSLHLHSTRCFRLLHLVNGAQCRQLFVARCAGSCSDSRGTARVSCAAHCEPIWGPVSLLACGDLNWCTRGVESSVRIRCLGMSSLCIVGAKIIVSLLDKE